MATINGESIYDSGNEDPGMVLPKTAQSESECSGNELPEQQDLSLQFEATPENPENEKPKSCVGSHQLQCNSNNIELGEYLQQETRKRKFDETNEEDDSGESTGSAESNEGSGNESNKSAFVIDKDVIIQWIDLNMSNQTEAQRNCLCLMKSCLENPACLQNTRDYFLKEFNMLLTKMGGWTQYPEISQQLHSQLENEDVPTFFGYIGMIFMQMYLKNQTKPSNNDNGASSSTMIIGNIDSQSSQQQYHTATIAECNDVALCSQEASQDINAQVATSSSSQDSQSYSVIQKKLMLLEEKLGEDFLQSVYKVMLHRTNNNRSAEIVAAGKFLFDKLFSSEEILAGNASGRTSGKTKQCFEKYDPFKTTVISELIDWLLTKPKEITKEDFQEYLQQSQNIGLIGENYKFFHQAVLVNYANNCRAKLLKANKPSTSPNN